MRWRKPLPQVLMVVILIVALTLICVWVAETPGNSDVLNNSSNLSEAQYTSYDLDVLNSPESVSLQIAAQKLARAYFRADDQEMGEYLAADLDTIEPYSDEDVYADVDYMVLKWNPKDVLSDEPVYVQYEYRFAGEDSVTYLFMEMICVDGEWKVTSYGLEK